MYCTSCGSGNPDASSYCSRCGTSLDELRRALTSADEEDPHVQLRIGARQVLRAGMVGSLLASFVAMLAVVFAAGSTSPPSSFTFAIIALVATCLAIVAGTGACAVALRALDRPRREAPSAERPTLLRGNDAASLPPAPKSSWTSAPPSVVHKTTSQLADSTDLRPAVDTGE